MKRTLYAGEHELFRETCRVFLDKEVVPYHDQWEADGLVSREVWRAAGAQGLLSLAVPEEYGGAGVDDFRFSCVLIEEMAKVGASGPGFGVHTDIVVPYLQTYGTDEQKQRWLPGHASAASSSPRSR